MSEQEYFDGVPMPSREEMRKFWEEQKALDTWAESLTPEQIHRLCDRGTFNSAIKGYLIAASREAEQTPEQTKALLNALRYVLDVKNMEDAEAVYKNWYDNAD